MKAYGPAADADMSVAIGKVVRCGGFAGELSNSIGIGRAIELAIGRGYLDF
jgi:hypothetical protein